MRLTLGETRLRRAALRSWGVTLAVLLSGVVLAIAPPAVARAESTIVVTTTADTVATDGFCSLREAIQAANTDLPVDECVAGSGADRIVFGVDGTITLSSTLVIASAVTIDGFGHLIALSGNNAVRVLNVQSGANLTLDRVTVQYGSGTGGGGIYNTGTLTILRSTVSQNASPSFSGGGLYNLGSATVIDSTFSENSAGRGGGIFADSGSVTTIVSSTLANNLANGASAIGGAVDAAGTLTVTNSTFSGNTAVNAANTGGGISNTGVMTLTHNTFLGNVGHIKSLSLNNYLAGNLLGPTAGGSRCCTSSVTDNGYNLSADATCNFTAPTSQGTVAIDLGELAGNSGPTPTHRLNPGSAGVGAIPSGTTITNNTVAYTCGQDGEPLDRDQRGVARPQGPACDVGAFEAEAYALTVVSEHGAVARYLDQETYHEEDIVRLTATPDAGWHFDGWTGDVTASENPVYVVMRGDTAVTANYLWSSYTLTVVSEHGTVARDPDQAEYHEGDVVQLTATPDAGWVFAGWTGDLAGSENPASVVVHSDMLVTASYVREIFTTTLRSAGGYDGWILESTESSSAGGTLDKIAATFRLGDESEDRQYRAILSFNASILPHDAVITGVTLKIKKQAQVGTNPFAFPGGLKVDMRAPYFGATPGLVPGDFQAPAGRAAVATFGATPVNGWYSAVLSPFGRAYVNKSGTTQFRLRFAAADNDDDGADYVRFYSGNGPASARPMLVVDYYLP